MFPKWPVILIKILGFRTGAESPEKFVKCLEKVGKFTIKQSGKV